MHAFQGQLIPANKKFPTLTFSEKSPLQLDKVYNGTYTLTIRSDWYEDRDETIQVAHDMTIVANLRTGQATVRFVISADDLKKMPRPLKGSTLTVLEDGQQIFQLTFDEAGGTVAQDVTLGKTFQYRFEHKRSPSFYGNELHDFRLDTKTGNQAHDLVVQLNRLANTWKSVSRTEAIPFPTQMINDATKYPNQGFVKQTGVNGIRTFTKRVEYIGAEPTGFESEETSAITKQPIPAIEVRGTKPSVEWRKETQNVSVAFETEYEHTMALPKNRESVKRQGVNGLSVLSFEAEYVNGVATGNKRNPSEKLSKPPISKIVERGVRSSLREANIDTLLYRTKTSGHGIFEISLVGVSEACLKMCEYPTLEFKLGNQTFTHTTGFKWTHDVSNKKLVFTTELDYAVAIAKFQRALINMGSPTPRRRTDSAEVYSLVWTFM